MRPTRSARVAALVGAALVAFAANSLLCRAALAAGSADPATFTLVRIGAGAVVLGLLARMRREGAPAPGSWGRALALFSYAACFSWAYLRVPAGVGALVLFASVQLTLIGWAMRHGAAPRGRQVAGIAIALGGLAWLPLPGASAPDPLGAVLMAACGASWGAYTLLGRSGGPPLSTTAAAFAWATPLAGAAYGLAAAGGALHAEPRGLVLATVSGAVTSGLGYAAWYAALPRLDATRAAVLQLAVPVLAMLGGIAFLGEPPHARLLEASGAVLLGIGLTIRGPGNQHGS